MGRLLAFTLAIFLPLLAACSVNPATGERNFTAFMSPEKEEQVGQEEHPKILAQFGGVLGHEIGHVTARHSAQRYSRAVEAPRELWQRTAEARS